MWLLVVLVVGAFLLALPLDLAFIYDSRPAGIRVARIVWGFGLVRARLRRRRKPPVPATRQRPRRWRWLGPRSRVGISTPGMAAAVVRRVRRIIGTVDIRVFEARAELGTGDPADTGVLFGLLAGSVAALPLTRRATVAIVPDFEEARSDVMLRGRVRVVPGVVLGHVLALAFSPPALHAFFRMARA